MIYLNITLTVLKTYSSIGNHDTYPIDQTQKNINILFLQISLQTGRIG